MPTGFAYTPDAADGGVHLRHFLSLYGGVQTKVGTIDLAPGAGVQSFTGIGFQPDALLLFSIVLSSAYPDDFDRYGYLAVGMSDGTNQWAGNVWMEDLGGNKSSIWRDDLIIAVGESTIDGEAELQSFDADGFSLNVITPYSGDTRGGSTDFEVGYLAIKTANGVAVGTQQARTTTGTQSITGLGFSPEAVFFASTQLPTLGINTGFARMMFGGADTDSNYVAWTGSKAGDLYCDNANRSGVCLAFMEDADGSGIPSFQVTSPCEASLQSLDADGFTLNYTVADGIGRYFSWFAVGKGEVGRWAQQTPADSPVLTAKKPQGLIFFMNNMYTSTFPIGHNQPLGTFGATLALGVCDRTFGQHHIGFSEISAPAFSVPRSVRDFGHGEAFGAYVGAEDKQAGEVSNNTQNRGLVTDFLGRRPQVMRYR